MDAAAAVTDLSLEASGQIFSANVVSEMVNIPLPITETVIKQGETLRLTVKLNQINANAHTDIGHDPKNQPYSTIQPGTKDTTVMTLLMPFKLPI